MEEEIVCELQEEQVKREKERCSGSYCQAVVFLRINYSRVPAFVQALHPMSCPAEPLFKHEPLQEVKTNKK